MRLKNSVTRSRSTKIFVAVGFGLITMLLTSCASPADPSTADPVTEPSPSPTLGVDSYTFESHGEASEVETAVLSGDYLVTWMISDNFFDDGEYEAMFAVVYHGPGTAETIVNELEVGNGSGTVEVDDLPAGEYYLTVSTSDEAEWSVTFERP
ncbi:hypothetical protein ACFQ3B_06120 [Stackebrandtia endophytica]|nr:hypothetical protein [Stackebrandtia endophytica]